MSPRRRSAACCVAAELANATVGQPRKSKEYSANLQNTPQVTEKDAAKMLNVAVRTVATASKVKREAAPEVFDAVARVSDAARVERPAASRRFMRNRRLGL